MRRGDGNSAKLGSASDDRGGRLRHRLPKFAVMPEKDPRAGRLAAGQLVERGEHGRAVMNAPRQSPLAQGPAEIAGVASEHDVARGEPYFQRLVARGMTVGRQADDAAVAEQIVLAIDPDHLVPEIEIGSAVAVPRGDVGVDPRLPLTLLNDHHRVGNERVASDMVEVKMRVDDDVDPRRVAADRLEPRADLLAWTVVEREQADEPLSEARGGVALAGRMHTGVEQGCPLGMLDQVGRNGQLRLALAALHQIAEIPGQMAASQGEELQAQSQPPRL